MPEAQRVLMICESLGAGGAEIAALTLAKALSERGHECFVASLWGPDTVAGRFEDAGIPVDRLGLAHRWRVDQGVARLAKVIRDRRPTVVHGQLFFAGLYTALTRPIASAPARVVTYQNLGYESYPADTAWLRVRKRIDSRAMRHGIDAHVGVSGAVRDHYSRELGVEFDTVIPNGIEAVTLARAPVPSRGPVLEKQGIDPGNPTVFCPARLVHEKGHRFLLQAIALLRDRGETPTLALAGGGPLEDEIVASIDALALGDQVRLLGSLPHEQALDLMRACDVVVLPSTHEGFPVAIAEASAVGATVVATRVGGIPDLVEDDVSGLLVKPADPPELAEALHAVLADERRRAELGRNAQSRVINLCDSQEVARRYEDLYRSITG